MITVSSDARVASDGVGRRAGGTSAADCVTAPTGQLRRSQAAAAREDGEGSDRAQVSCDSHSIPRHHVHVHEQNKTHCIFPFRQAQVMYVALLILVNYEIIVQLR